MVTDVSYIPHLLFLPSRCSCQVATVVGPPLKTLRCLMGKSYMWKCPLPRLNIYIYWWICKGVIFEQPYSLSSSFPQIKLHTLYPCMFAAGPIQTRQVRSRHQANTLAFFVVRQPFQASCTAKRSNGFL